MAKMKREKNEKKEIGKEIKPVAFAKDLGVVLDPSPTYNDHVALTVSSCMVGLGQINRVKHAFDTNTLRGGEW